MGAVSNTDLPFRTETGGSIRNFANPFGLTCIRKPHVGIPFGYCIGFLATTTIPLINAHHDVRTRDLS